MPTPPAPRPLPLRPTCDAPWSTPAVVASYAVEQFSVEALVELTPEQVQARFREFKRLTHFDE